MIRSWQALGLPLVLAGALTARAADNGQAGKAPVEPNRDDAISRDLRELRLAVEALTKKVDSFQTARLDADLQQFQKNSKDIEEIRRTLVQLRQDLDGLRQGLASERRSGYPPAATQAGRVRLVNTYPQPVTIVLNSRAYTLLSGETRTVDAVPAGPFTYEVLGIQAAMNRTLDPNETYTITVHPR